MKEDLENNFCKLKLSSFSGTSTVISIGCMCFNTKLCDALGRSIYDDFCVLAVSCGHQMVFLSLVVSQRSKNVRFRDEVHLVCGSSNRG